MTKESGESTKPRVKTITVSAVIACFIIRCQKRHMTGEFGYKQRALSFCVFVFYSDPLSVQVVMKGNI